MDQLNKEEQKTLAGRLEARQMKEMITMYQRVVGKCFADCITEFKSNELNDHERKCVTTCFDKQSSAAERLSTRFQEKQTQFMQGP
ncbi:MAG: hypothetical protein M1814_002654 [Vezdaea aestivalis]|nr:MAG: hypothetical protein M1814_002654 [Vezdaea aestivalis]